MTNFAKTAGLAGILTVVVAIAASPLFASQPASPVREGQAVVTKLDATTSAITYWVSRSDGWHVVTTVDAVAGQAGDAEKHTTVRFSSVLLPAQSQVISIPVAVGERQEVLRIRRLGDQMEVARIPDSEV